MISAVDGFLRKANTHLDLSTEIGAFARAKDFHFSSQDAVLLSNSLAWKTMTAVSWDTAVLAEIQGTGTPVAEPHRTCALRH